jgi:GH15 family glucan-1,4-alpha-glucosidase
VALVGIYGSIDFMCAPRFDSASVFAALLDDQRDGRFQLAPFLEDARQRQLYLPDTCVLLSRFLSDDVLAEVSDFMPIGDERQAHDLVRHAKTVRGEARFMKLSEAFGLHGMRTNSPLTWAGWSARP